MSRAQIAGDKIAVRGVMYRIVGVGAKSTDPKFWGKRVFVLINMETGEKFRASGTKVQHNSRLSPVKEN